MPSYRKFKSPINKFKKAKSRQKSPSPARRDYEKRVQTKPSKERCLFIDARTNKRCQLEIGIYPEYCQYHTSVIDNLFIKESNVKGGGNGLFAGPMGFKKGDIIGEYSKPYTKVRFGRVYERNGKGKKTIDSYVYCLNASEDQDEDDPNIQCWDSLDKNSTITRNANSAFGTKFKYNAEFIEEEDSKGDVHVYMVATKNIPALTEIFCHYGDAYIFH